MQETGSIDLILGNGFRPRSLSEEPGAARELAAVDGLPAWIRDQVARLAGVETHRIDPGVPLARHGLDSLASVELLAALSTKVGHPVPAEALIDCGGIEALASIVLSGYCSGKRDGGREETGVGSAWGRARAPAPAVWRGVRGCAERPPTMRVALVAAPSRARVGPR